MRPKAVSFDSLQNCTSTRKPFTPPMSADINASCQDPLFILFPPVTDAATLKALDNVSIAALAAAQDDDDEPRDAVAVADEAATAGLILTRAIVPITTQELTMFRQLLKDCMNRFRAGSGRRFLIFNVILNKIAQDWSREMANRNQLFHNPNLGQQATNAGYRWGGLGENVAFASFQGSVSQVASRICNLWFNSASHRANMLDSRWVDLGIGYVRTTNGLAWCTAIFGFQRP